MKNINRKESTLKVKEDIWTEVILNFMLILSCCSVSRQKLQFFINILEGEGFDGGYMGDEGNDGGYDGEDGEPVEGNEY